MKLETVKHVSQYTLCSKIKKRKENSKEIMLNYV